MIDFLDTGFLTHLLSHILQPVLANTNNVVAFAKSTIRILVLIELVLFGLYFSLGSENLQSGIKKVLQIGFFSFLLINFGWLADTIRDSLIKVGLMAAGNSMSISEFMDPSAFIQAGFRITSNLYPENDGSNNMMSLLFGPLSLVSLVCQWVMMIAFVIMGWQVFFAIVEFYFKTTLAIIFLPFGVLKQTQGLARNAIDGVVAACVKLMVVAFITALIFPVITNLAVFEDPSLTQFFTMMVGALTMALLMWRAPAMASSLLGNTSAFDVASTFLAPVAATAFTMTSMARISPSFSNKTTAGNVAAGARVPESKTETSSASEPKSPKVK